MSIAPPGLVVPSPRLLNRSRYGLLNTFEPIQLDSPHAWASGVEWEFDLCTSLEAFTDKCPPESFTKSTETDLEYCHAEPFIVKSSFDCSTGGRSVEESFTIAERRLLAWESYKVEQVFWTGTTANGQINPSLAFGNSSCGIDPIDLTPSGLAVNPIAAVAVLEEALTDVVPGSGVLHIPYGLTSYLVRYGLLHREDDKYYSATGFQVVVGAGYPGSGPANAVANNGSTWIFATGPLEIWRSEYFMNPRNISEGINRYRNDITVFGERFYIVGFSCALYTVNVCL